VRLDELAVLDHAAPGARLVLLHLDERLEAVQVGAHGALDVAHAARRLLDQRAGVDVHVSSIRVSRGASSWNVTTPVCVIPCETRHLMRSSGRWVSMSAVNSFVLPQIFVAKLTRAVVVLGHPRARDA
jgi:hypothetical protein